MIETILSKFKNVKRTGANRWSCSCPAHEDKSPSMGILLTDKKTLIHCFGGCDWKSICDAVGIEPTDLFFYEGTHVYPSGRYNKPRFRNPVTNRRAIAPSFGDAVKDKSLSIPLYCAPSEEAVAKAETVFITEGETDADAIGRIGGHAVCSHSPGLPPRSDISILKGKLIIIIPDNDAEGFKHLKKTIDRLAAYRIPDDSVKVLTPSPEYKDIRDMIVAKEITSLDQILHLVSEPTIKPRPVQSLQEGQEDGLIALKSELGLNNCPRNSATVLKTGELVSLSNLNGSEFGSFKYATEVTLASGLTKLVPALKSYIVAANPTRIDTRTVDTREKQLSLYVKDNLTYFNLWAGWQVTPTAILNPHPITGLPDGYHQLFMNLAGIPIYSDPPDGTLDEDGPTEEQEAWTSVLYLIDWLAWVIQFPMQRLHFAAFIYSIQEGVGKGLLGDMMMSFYGNASLKLGDNDLFSNFSVIDDGTLFALVNEITLTPSFGSNPMNRLKVLITEDKVIINKKGMVQYQAKNNCSFLITSNKPGEIAMATQSRRFLVHCVPNSTKQLDVVTQKLVKKNRSEFLAFLLNHQIRYLSFGTPPPSTSGKELSIQSGKKDPLKEFMTEWLSLDSTPTLFTSTEAKNAFNQQLDPISGEKHASEDSVGHVMASLGYRSKPTKFNGKTVRFYRKPAVSSESI
jgi:hypothetical protein